MRTLFESLARPRRGATRRAYRKLETRILVSQGRKAVRTQARRAAKVARKAVKTGLITGGIAAASVVVRAVRKRRREG